MKRIIATLLAAAALSANAQTFIAANEGGGGIVLTFRQCEDVRGKDLWHGYAFDKGGLTVRGCWGLIDGLVHMIYESGETRVYPQSIFIKMGESKKKSDSI